MVVSRLFEQISGRFKELIPLFFDAGFDGGIVIAELEVSVSENESRLVIAQDTKVLVNYYHLR